jgi:hypothetical protein
MRYPELVGLTLALAESDRLGHAARSGAHLLPSLMAHHAALARVADLEGKR